MIKLKEGCQIKRAYPYRISIALRSEVKWQIQELTGRGLTYPVESPHAHPIVRVAKRDGGLHICIDNCRLNAVTEPDAFQMRRADELRLQVANASYITVIGMLYGYRPEDESAQGCTTFVTHRVQYAWRLMPYGLHNSASSFQHAMNQILAPMQIMLVPTLMTSQRFRRHGKIM